MTFAAVPLKHLATGIDRGNAPTYSDSDDGDAFAVGQSCQRPDHTFDPSRARLHLGAVPKKGRLTGSEVLINSTGTGTLGRVVALRGLPAGLPWFADGHITVIRVDEHRADPRFIGYALGLPFFGRYAEDALSVGATKQKELNVELVRRHAILAPQVGQQQAIVDFLDRQCGQIAALEQRLDRLVVVSEDEVSTRIEESVRAVSAESRPLAWTTDPARPIMYGIVLPGEPVSDGVLLIKGGNVERGQLLPEHLVRVDRAIESKFARARLRAGDLLVTIRGSWGASAQVPPESDGANITQDTARVSPAEHVDARFLLHVLRAPSSRVYMESVVRGTGVKGINIFDLRRLKVPVPSLAEQRMLSARFDAWTLATARLRATAQLAKTRLHEYRDALITEAVTGQFDVTTTTNAQLDERLHEAAESVA